MNEQYLQDLYGWIKGNDASYETRYTYDQFKQKMQDSAYATKMHNWIATKDDTFNERRPLSAFIEKVKVSPANKPTQVEQPTKVVPSKKKFALESSSEGSFLDSQSTVKEKQAVLTKKALDKYKEDNAAPFSSTAGKLFAGTTALIGSPIKSIYQAADDLIVSARKGLQEQGFFDDDIPDTNSPITDAIKKKASTIQNFDTRPKSDGGPLDPTPFIAGAAELGLKIINSQLPQEQKNVIINSLNLGDAYLKRGIRQINKVQDYALPKDNLAVTVAENILGIVPDIIAADLMGKPAVAEGKLTKFATEVSENAKPLIQKYLPKAAKFIEEAIRAPFTKIMAAKGIASGVANAKEGEDIINAGIEGGLEGTKEGVIMHGLGEAAGKLTPKIAKVISKTGMDSKFAVSIANPLANAGVFTTAKAIRTPIEQGRLATAEELAAEAGTGVGFSLLHAGSLYKTHNEADHYYDNVLTDEPTELLGRVINETKGNLDLAYNPDLTETEIKDLKDARDQIKKAILKEPDLKNKLLLGDEAVKIQNQLDAHFGIKEILQNKESIVKEINDSKSLSDEQKTFFSKKVEVMADHFDNSELSLRNKELDVKIAEVQKDYDSSQSEEDRLKLETLNQEKNAIQKQRTNKSVLRTEQPKLGLQEVGERNAKPEGLTEEQTIINAKPEEEVEPSMLIKDAIADEIGVYYYNGEKGQVNLDGQTVVFETKDKLFDLGNVDELSENTLEDFGIGKEQELNLKLNEDNSVELNGKKYVNNYSNPESAFSTDKDGNYSVTLETENGQKRTFRGQQADQIVYETRLKNFEENGNEQQIEDAHTAADEAIRIETEIGETAPKRKGKSVRKGKQRTLKTVKEPLTKSERTQQGNAKPEVSTEENIITTKPEEEITPTEVKVETNPELEKIKSQKVATEEPKTKPTWEEIPKGERTIDDIRERIRDVKEKNKEILGASIKDLLKLNPKKEGSLKKISNYLENLDRALDLDPNELNDVTRVMAVATAKAVIKTLKALVNAGISLQEAIRMASGAHKVKEEQIVEALNIVSKINENKSEGISEFELKGYNKFSKVVDSAIANGKTIDNILSYMKRSEVYKNATDVQKELLVRQLRKKFGLRERSSPLVSRLFGTLRDVKKITMTEKAALVKQIKDLGRGAKDAVRAFRLTSEQLSKDIKELNDKGKITVEQAANVLRKFSKTNVFSETSVSRFTDYMTKVFANAEYADKLSSAKSTKSDISKLAKNTKKDANLRDLATKFLKIDPSMVDDIYEYNDMASKIKEAVKGSTIRGQKINWADTVNVKDAIEFTQKTIEIQDEKLREERLAELESLMGVDGSDFTDAELKELLVKEKNFTEDDDKIVRAMAKKAFDIYSSVIKEVVATGKDAFTGEEVNYNKTQKELIKKFMDMNLDMLNSKSIVEARDALLNFLVNKSTARMGLVYEEYQGIKGTKELESKGIKSRPLKKLGSKLFGRILGDEFTTLPILFEKMFPGLNRSTYVMDKIGLSDVIQKNDQAVKQANTIVDNYISKFFKRKANSEDFNTQYNNVERDLAGYMIRSIAGTSEQIQKEFDDRREVIEGSIKALSKGDADEQSKAELYQKAYDKILKDSKNAKDVLDKTDKVNVEAIDFYIKEFGDRYEQMADVSENIYNTILEKDINYTPDRVSKLSKNTGEVDLNDDDSAFHNNNGSIILKKAGSLQQISRLDKIPKGKYINLSFDKNMANAMYDLLLDVNTAAAVKRLNAAINSPYFENIMSNAEDLKILKGDKRDRTMGRIELYIKNMRNKNPYSNDELSKGMRILNKISKLGVGQALAGVSQPFKQIIPVALNTFINADGNLNLGAGFNADKIAFINNSGYGIANRGRQSLAEIETVNKLIEKASLSKGQRFIKAIEDINEAQLKYLLEKPDVFIAKMSWLTYYEQSLKKQGIDINTVNYKDHKLDKKAADYAEKQVTRQQNVNNHDLAGRLYTTKNTYAQIFTKMLMSFSSFRMNSSSRFGADMITLQDKTSSKEDRSIAIKSIAGYAAEMAVFRAISIGASLLIGTLAKKYLGKDETDKDYQERKENLIKGAETGVFNDLFSPIPILDPLVQQSGAKLTEGIDELMGTDIAIYDVPKQTFLSQYGTFGITADRLGKLWDLGNLAATGKYVDDYGNKKSISQDEQNSLKPLVPLFVSTSVGILPNDINLGINNAVKFAKKGEGKINKTELEKSNPTLYKRLYEENRTDIRIKERENRIKEREKRIR